MTPAAVPPPDRPPPDRPPPERATPPPPLSLIQIGGLLASAVSRSRMPGKLDDAALEPLAERLAWIAAAHPPRPSRRRGPGGPRSR